MGFLVILDPRAIDDIQSAIDYYDDQLEGLGKRFDTELDEYLVLIKRNPYFQIRYDHIHCLPLKTFPYMIHFSINEDRKTLTVLAVLFTGASIEKWKR